MKAKKNSYLLYVGPSMITGAGNVFALITGFLDPSKNEKTGPVLQVWFICADLHPQDALDNGEDEQICGDCPFRKVYGGRICYVELQPVFSMYRAFVNGDYEFLPSYALLNGRIVRLGAYGDPACVPEEVLANIKAHAKVVLGYSHMWKEQRFNHLTNYVKASIEQAEQKEVANALGFHTYRIKAEGGQVLKGEHFCTHKKNGTQCYECRGCTAATDLDTVACVHGVSFKKNNFYRRIG